MRWIVASWRRKDGGKKKQPNGRRVRKSTNSLWSGSRRCTAGRYWLRLEVVLASGSDAEEPGITAGWMAQTSHKYGVRYCLIRLTNCSGGNGRVYWLHWIPLPVISIGAPFGGASLMTKCTVSGHFLVGKWLMGVTLWRSFEAWKKSAFRVTVVTVHGL